MGQASITLTDVLRVQILVPKKHVEEYIQAIQDHIPSFLGDYDRVLWYGEGVEQFRPLTGANPAQGQCNTTEREPSVNIVFFHPRDKQAVQELCATVLVPNHPWNAPIITVEETNILNP